LRLNKTEKEEYKMAELGNIKISNEVVGIIAGIAAMEIKGVHSMAGNFTDGITNILGKRNLSKGVKVEVGEKECSIDANIRVEYGVRIPDVAIAVQQRILKAVTDMTGLKVVEVNVYVQDIYVPKEETEEKVTEIKLK
jgi:uncharacterized alkaline shock family protein YloU